MQKIPKSKKEKNKKEQRQIVQEDEEILSKVSCKTDLEVFPKSLGKILKNLQSDDSMDDMSNQNWQSFI